MIDVNLASRAGRAVRRRDFILLHVELQGVRPTVSRTLVVPRKANLGWIHAAIQITMGWTNSHLHQFHLDDVFLSDPSFDLQEFDDDPPVGDEGSMTLDHVLKAKPLRFSYEYDFGDSWIHTLTLEAVPDGQPTIAKQALCVAGHRACPPEDCGGVPGYANVLKALSNRKHPEHRSTQQWLGRPFDPEGFSVEEANRFLAMLPWPRVSIDALGEVLEVQMEADGRA